MKIYLYGLLFGIVLSLKLSKCVVSNVRAVHTTCSQRVLLDFSLTVKAATLVFISGWGSAIPSAKEGKSGFIYNLVKS